MVRQRCFDTDAPPLRLCESIIIDSTICCAHPSAAGALKSWCLKKKGGTESQALGRSQGGFSTKNRIAVDGLGNPLRIHLTPGQRHDIVEAEGLIIGYNSEYVIGDKRYDSDAFIAVIKANGAIAVIPPKSHRVDQRTYDKHLYKERHRVECFINKIKWYRRIFSRFEKLAVRYFGFLSFVSTSLYGSVEMSTEPNDSTENFISHSFFPSAANHHTAAHLSQPKADR